jgi:hypothetical protein
MSLIICACNTDSTQVCSEDRSGMHDAEGKFKIIREGIIKSICVTPEIIFATCGLISAGERLKTFVQGLAHLSFDHMAEAIPRVARELMKDKSGWRARLCLLLTGWDRERRRIRAIGYFWTNNFEPSEARLELGPQHLIFAPGPEAQNMASGLLQQGATLPEVFAQLADAFPEIGRGLTMHAIMHAIDTSLPVMELGTVGSQAPSWTFGNGNALNVANDFKHSGSKALKITNAPTTGSYSYQDFSVTNGRVYSLQGWIKTDAMTGTLNGALLNVDIVSGVTAFTIISKTGTDFASTQPDVGIPADGVAHDWTFVRCLFKPTGSGVLRVYCQLGNNNNTVTGSAWFDDVGVFPTGATYTSLAASTGYYLYEYIDVASSLLKFANGSPPGTSPSDSLAVQCALDGRIPLPPKKITTPASGGTGSDTGGGSGTCPEFDAPVFVRRYSQECELLFEGVIKAGEVQPGYESDDGTIKRGDFLKGYSFNKRADVYRAVHQVAHVSCAGWVKLDGVRLTSCEAVYDWDGGAWAPAYKVPGAVYDGYVGVKVLLQVEADWDDEHNYYVGRDTGPVRLIHNFVLPC